MIVELMSHDVGETMGFGRRLAALLRPGDVISLSGPLGAGKTAFAGGLAEGLGIEEPVTSPSFVIMRRYDSGFTPLIHVDVYRLTSHGEFDDLDAFEEARDGVLLVEWGNAIAGCLPSDHLDVEIGVQDETTRTLVMTPSGSWIGRPLQELSV